MWETSRPPYVQLISTPHSENISSLSQLGVLILNSQFNSPSVIKSVSSAIILYNLWISSGANHTPKGVHLVWSTQRLNYYIHTCQELCYCSKICGCLACGVVVIVLPTHRLPETPSMMEAEVFLLPQLSCSPSALPVASGTFYWKIIVFSNGLEKCLMLVKITRTALQLI